MSFPDLQLDLPHTNLKRWHNNNLRRGYSPTELQSMAESQLRLVERGMPPLIHPIICTPGPGEDYDKRKTQQLYIVAGSRRHAGNATLGKNAPLLNCIVRYYPDESSLIAAMRVENGQRKDLSPMEWGVHFDEAIKAGEPLPQLVRESGKTTHQIGIYLALLKLAPESQTLVDSGDLPLGAIDYLLHIPNPAKQVNLANRFAKQKYTLKRMETAVAMYVPKKKSKQIARPATHELPKELPASIANLRSAAAITCHTCDIGNKLTTREPAWHLAMNAAGETCETCEIKDIKNICAGCPLAAMMSRVARTLSHQPDTVKVIA